MLQHWSVQSVDVEKYIGKEIEIHRFIVKNHILDNAKDNKKRQTVVCVLAVDGRAFGGSSLPDWDEVYRGGVWSLEGKTLEEVTGIDFLEWSDKWEKRFGQP